jgi:hypothetical protein
MFAVNSQEDLKEFTMRKDDHPDVLFDALASVQAKYKCIARANVTEVPMVIQVIRQVMFCRYSGSLSCQGSHPRHHPF